MVEKKLNPKGKLLVEVKTPILDDKIFRKLDELKRFRYYDRNLQINYWFFPIENLEKVEKILGAIEIDAKNIEPLQKYGIVIRDFVIPTKRPYGKKIWEAKLEKVGDIIRIHHSTQKYDIKVEWIDTLWEYIKKHNGEITNQQYWNDILGISDIGKRKIVLTRWNYPINILERLGLVRKKMKITQMPFIISEPIKDGVFSHKVVRRRITYVFLTDKGRKTDDWKDAWKEKFG